MDSEFPVWALLPKRETGVTSFLNKYPEYDGRGITIAILDSGVDPGAPGLQVTSDGKVKVTARYDCSGAGDVDTSTVVEPINGTITGLTGRTLTIPLNWNNPAGKFHIGFKSAYELYPKPLKDRIEGERKLKKWDPGYKTAAAESNRQLTETIKVQDASKNTLTRLDKLHKEDFEAQIEMLNHLEKKYEDRGSAYDCVVFHDGTMWRVCIDTSECGDLASCKLMGEFEKTFEYSCLTKEDLLNYSVNVHEDGNLLEIVSMSSSHGTHVASIAAAYFPEQPEKNGIAPGAQIVSLSIGDQRISTMETGTALTRAMIKVMDSQKTNNPITVINTSYGEQANWSSSGRIGELMNEVIDKYGVTWVAAAGNHGPCLCTIGTPPDINTENIIGVGAYVSPEMMVAEYSLRSKAPGLPYTWSSRGPTMDGGKGVSICAPGGAITSVPQYLLRNAQLLNGTSMASPHVAGAVAILLSGLKIRNLKHTPYSIRRALENTAHYLQNADHFAQGHGLLQVEKAFEHLTTYSHCPENRVRFNVLVNSGRNKGVHMRSGLQNKAKDYAVSVEPVFADTTNIELKEKLSFQMSFSLVCDQPWVHHPAHLELNNLTRSINVRVDPSGLPVGVHATSIRGYDIKQIDKGPLFSVEVTVVRPHYFTEQSAKPMLEFTSVHLKPGELRRHFILVPDKAAYAVVKLNILDPDKSGNFIIHAIQLSPKKACKTNEFNKMSLVKPDADGIHAFKVKGGIVMEFVLAKYWSEQFDSLLNYSIQFTGCPLPTNEITMHHAQGILQLDVLGGLQIEEICPIVSLKMNVVAIKPSEAKIMPCSSRDIIPPSRHIYQLLLTYNFHLPKLTEVTPNCALLSKFLYESEFESQLWMLFDSNKQYISSGDAFPKKYTIKLEKGDYVIRQQVRHEKKEMLEKITDLPMLLYQKLANPISLDVHATLAQAMLQGKKLSSGMVPSGFYRLPIYIAPFQGERSLKNITPGQFLWGTITLSKSELGKKVDSYPFKYILTDLTKKSNSNNNLKSQPEKTKWEEYQDALRDLKTTWLAKMDNNENAEKLYRELKDEFTTHVTSHVSMLQSMEPDSKKVYPGSKETDESLQLARCVLKIANEVCESIDQKSLLAYLGMKSDLRPEASVIKLSMDKQKNALIESLSRKGSVLCRFFIKNTPTAGEGETTFSLEAIDELWLTLLKFVDSSDVKATGYFGLWHAAAHNHYGRFLKLGLKMYEEKSSIELEESIIWCLKQMEWTFAANHIARSTQIRYPPSYRLL